MAQATVRIHFFRPHKGKGGRRDLFIGGIHDLRLVRLFVLRHCSSSCSLPGGVRGWRLGRALGQGDLAVPRKEDAFHAGGVGAEARRAQPKQMKQPECP